MPMSTAYYATIGLEIHAELATASKMFCSCKNDPDEEKPNTNICPVCMAHPGTLPVPNIAAIESVMRVGLAIGGMIADFTEFDRKNYFYPDIPKGYQISQYKYPIVSGGHLASFDVTRIHLEEDTGTSKHDKGDYSLVDFNRAGVPLMELVTEPHTFETSEEAAKAASIFAKELQLLLTTLGVSNANMEKGEMRVEANISLSPTKDAYGTKVEVKNLNSFRSVERAIAYELLRMKELYEEGKEGEIVQETRGWDEGKQTTFSQRSKENASDYRYFPDPDIPKFSLKKMFGDNYERLAALPELPSEKRMRYERDFGIKPEDIETYVSDPLLGAWFEDVAAALGKGEAVLVASNFTTSDILGLRMKDETLSLPEAKAFADLIALFQEGKLSSRATKDILAILMKEGGDPLAIATERDLFQMSNESDLLPVIEKVVAANEKMVADYKGGKDAALQGLLGLVIKETRGKANPQVAGNILRTKLSV